MDPNGSGPSGADEEVTDTSAKLPAAATTQTSEVRKPYKHKYKEAAPTPDGFDEVEWDKNFAAADSRIYHANFKNAKKSAAARATGETYALAFEMWPERLAKAAKNKKSSTITSSAIASPAITSSATTSSSTIPTVTMDSEYIKVPTSKGNKARKVQSSTSRSATPDGLTEPATPITIADKVKGKKRVGRKPLIQESSGDPVNQQPEAYFGRQDPKQPEPFWFGPSSVPDFDPKQPFRGKDSLPTKRQEFNALSTSFGSLTMDWKDNFDREADLEVNARNTNDFDPDEKTESGPGKRYAGFEPFVRGSAISPITSRSNTPVQKEPTKPAKKRTNRGQKKKAAAAKKKAAAKDKGKGKSVEPEQEEEEEEEEEEDGASSNDGRVYCVCRGPDDHRPMIACDNCDEWYHCSCVNVKEGDVVLIDKYICKKCHIPNIHYTTWKPMCRLEGCRKPCDLTQVPPSKYCTPEHKKRFWEQAVQRAPDGPTPSRGGALTKGELKALLNKTKGDVKAFHALGKKPTLPTAPEAIDWAKILTDEEKGRLCEITANKLVLKTRSEGFKDKEKVVRMAMSRLKKAIDDQKDLVGVCGWDTCFAMNEEEFQVWRNSETGVKAFENNILDSSFCEKKRCLRHVAWVKVTMNECHREENLVQKALGKLRAEEHSIKDRANTRAASQM